MAFLRFNPEGFSCGIDKGLCYMGSSNDKGLCYLGSSKCLQSTVSNARALIRAILHGLFFVYAKYGVKPWTFGKGVGYVSDTRTQFILGS